MQFLRLARFSRTLSSLIRRLTAFRGVVIPIMGI